MAKNIANEIPVLVKVISVLYYIGAVAVILLGIFAFIGSEYLFSYIPSTGLFGGLFIMLGIIFLALGVLFFFVARGLWKGRNWARILVIILSALAIINALRSFSNGWVSLIINLLIGGYLLLSKDVKAAFH